MPRWFPLFVGLLALIVVTPLPVHAAQPDDAAKAAATAEKVTGTEEYYELLRLFVDTLDQVERNYVKDIGRRELLEAAIDGMLEKLDEHSDYIAPDDLDRFKSGVESEFGGIGIQVEMRTGRLTVISPLVGSPAYRAGLMAGDVVTHIKGDPVADLSLDDAVKKMKGPVGTSVKLRVRHPHDGSTEEVELEREMVRVETVLGERRQDDDSWDFMLDPDAKIGYIRLTAFARHTVSDLRRAIEQLDDADMQGLIIDLRFNPGGLLSAAIQISDMFIAEGRIVSTSGRNVKSQTWDAHRRGSHLDFPIAVLVNRYSASASEIVAACLQDHERAIIIGERTFGKGSVQNIVPLEQGRSALKLTTAGYQRPSGKNIHRFPGAEDDDDWGVKPDDGYEVELTNRQIRRLVQQRQARDIVRRGRKATEGGDADDEDDTDEAEDADDDQAEEAESDDDADDDADDEKPVADEAIEMALEYLTAEIADKAKAA